MPKLLENEEVKFSGELSDHGYCFIASSRVTETGMVRYFLLEHEPDGPRKSREAKNIQPSSGDRSSNVSQL